MKIRNLVLFLVLPFLAAYQTVCAIQIDGGRIEDIIVVGNGSSDSTFASELLHGWFAIGPNAFDIDTHGDIYILDWLGGKVLKFNQRGRFKLAIRVAKEIQRSQQEPSINDITVDNWGNLYLVENYSIDKFSQEGSILLEIPHVRYGFILTDEDGRVYGFTDNFWGGISVYSPGGEHKAEIYHKNGYRDIGIVQKEAGNDIYFRTGKYLVRTNLEEHSQGGKIDTVSILPDGLRLFEFAENQIREEGYVEHPLILIGFDTDSCFYFSQFEDLCGVRWIPICLTLRIFKYHLVQGKLTLAGKVEISFEKGKKECSDKELRDFAKQFLVTGDGTIYWLYGSVDTVKVSKIIFDE